ncbi:hypothetical protein OROGR_014685 [Orobanche gracilis]
MHSTTQKVSDAAAVAKEHVDILKAKVEEKAQNVVARTKEEKEIAHELRKAKEAEAKMKMHQAKAENAEKKMYKDPKHGLYSQHRHRPEGGHLDHHEPVGATLPPGGVAPTYPLGGGHRTGWTDPK